MDQSVQTLSVGSLLASIDNLASQLKFKKRLQRSVKVDNSGVSGGGPVGPGGAIGSNRLVSRRVIQKPHGGPPLGDWIMILRKKTLTKVTSKQRGVKVC